ncbi:MAG TPA: hypothetical protein VE175_03230 [Woeseiaceae bacterium]|nr:hypothetical protein [Woeseiaceae bacterium]
MNGDLAETRTSDWGSFPSPGSFLSPPPPPPQALIERARTEAETTNRLWNVIINFAEPRLR